jgi:hypothetical protein
VAAVVVAVAVAVAAAVVVAFGGAIFTFVREMHTQSFLQEIL